MSVGKNIKRIRKQKGFTQKELAEKLGVSQQNLAQYEGDKRNPKLETIIKIADGLNVSIDELTTGTDENEIIVDQKTLDIVIKNTITQFNHTEFTSFIDGLKQAYNTNELESDKLQAYLEQIIFISCDLLNFYGKCEAAKELHKLIKCTDYRIDLKQDI